MISTTAPGTAAIADIGVPPSNIHMAFARCIASRPDAVALVSDATGPITYAGLDARSRRITAELRALGIGRRGPGDVVALLAPRSADAVAAMLGILRAGAAYAPLDPELPPAVLATLVEDLRPAALLLASPAAAAAPEGGPPAIDLGALLRGAGPEAGPAADHVDSATGPDAPAYVMFTSGSTGRPKGTIVPHRAVLRLVLGMDYAELSEREVILQSAPLAFDASTFEIWGALLNGGVLVLPPPGPLGIDAIADEVARRGVTTLWLTAGLFHAVADHAPEALRPLRQLLAGGDVLSPVHVERVLRACPGLRMVNGYGPTENTTFTLCWTVPPGYRAADGPLPVGHPIAGTGAVVLDPADLRPLPEGAEGELCAWGEGLALGYLGADATGGGRFTVADPGDGSGPRRVYRTGDLARRRAVDGAFEFLGRLDRQVKVDGKRVELDGVEAALRALPGVRDAAADIEEVPGRSGAASHRRVVASLARVAGPEGTALTEAAALAGARLVLPGYAVPSALRLLAVGEPLPLTPNGKVDRAALRVRWTATSSPPRMAGSTPTPDPTGTVTAGDAAEGGIEATVLEAWRRALGRPEGEVVDETANFFDLGGTSLRLVEAHALLRRALPEAAADLTLVEMFSHPSARALAARLARAGRAGPSNARTCSVDAVDTPYGVSAPEQVSPSKAPGGLRVAVAAAARAAAEAATRARR